MFQDDYWPLSCFYRDLELAPVTLYYNETPESCMFLFAATLFYSAHSFHTQLSKGSHNQLPN